jgi:hypothetical protein
MAQRVRADGLEAIGSRSTRARPMDSVNEGGGGGEERFAFRIHVSACVHPCTPCV